MALYAQFDCSMPRELARKGVDWQHRAVYGEAVLYCRENLTDGVITRGDLAFWMGDLPAGKRSKMLDRLVNLQALEPHPEGWRIPDHVWRKWNPTKAQVDTKRAEGAERKAEWRERRRRDRNVSVNGHSDVPVGHVGDMPVTDASRDARVPGLSQGCPRQPEPEPEPEPELREERTQDDSLPTDVTSITHLLGRVIGHHAQTWPAERTGGLRA